MVGRLVAESDRVVRGLVEGWEEERRVGRLVGAPLLSLCAQAEVVLCIWVRSTTQISETKQSRFPLLTNPQLLPPLFPSLHTQAQPQLSLSALATSTTSHLPNLSTASNLLQSYARPGGTSTPTPGVVVPPVEEEPGPDARDVDKVLGELVALGGRWALFRRFVYGRLVQVR